jgi:hydrogenase 3 maturation protease
MKKALLVIGNDLRGDDGAALYLGKLVEKNLPEWKVFFGNDTPEDKIYQIRDFNPDLLVVADSVVGLESKSEFLEVKSSPEYIFTTHNIPTYILINLLENFAKKVFFLGINVKKENLSGINMNLSDEAKENSLNALLQIKKFNSLFN